MAGEGKPIPEGARLPFEQSFGRDFSDVRVHTDASSSGVTQMNARAFTLGQDIFFGPGQYSPDSSHGKKLLAHELTHVVQQSAGRDATSKGQRAEADLNSQLVAGGMRASIK